ncbi:hypothetical protein [Solimicrobium silvestre]|uniref:Lipoprotein n=1 Tax=Solimicrobium silvestre TaxID=2099400 RepID=A0A2S9GZD4_9BURK|nr:hypothetical protein [Solimicrobium silvestre]PRC93099.1 hypothetical protein S2091_2185 [Solimicrobium silvestre]
MEKIFILFWVTLLSACSTTQTLQSEAKQVKSENIYAYQMKSSVADAHIFVTRDSGIYGIACTTSLLINGKLVAKFEAGERAEFYLPSGEYILAHGVASKGLCRLGKDSGGHGRETFLRSGETKWFRLYLEGDNGDIAPIIPQ